MMTSEDILFHIFSVVSILTALLVVFLNSPIYSALFLAATMSILGIFFFILQAPFVAVAQITVYAGAVMVLFIMVVMLFDLKKEHEDVFKFSPLAIAKISGSALLCGLLIGIGWLGFHANVLNGATVPASLTTQKDLDKSQAPFAPIDSRDQTNPQVASQNTKDDPDEDLTEAEAANLVDQKNKLAHAPTQPEFGATAALSQRLFTKYVFAFEAVSLLLLVAIVGSVALAKSKGGTHNVV